MLPSSPKVEKVWIRSVPQTPFEMCGLWFLEFLMTLMLYLSDINFSIWSSMDCCDEILSNVRSLNCYNCWKYTVWCISGRMASQSSFEARSSCYLSLNLSLSIFFVLFRPTLIWNRLRACWYVNLHYCSSLYNRFSVRWIRLAIFYAPWRVPASTC